jgi:hypothetical protein
MFAGMNERRRAFSYLCRMIDILNMGYVDEIIFGREVLTRLPEVAREWKAKYDYSVNNQ